MSARWHAPLDPHCPAVVAYSELLDDPITDAIGAPVDEIMEDFERRHRRSCKRCQDYGAVNIEIE